MIKLLKGTAILLGLLVVTILLALLFVDFGRFETRIERMVSEATGREFRIDGGLEIRALPSIRVTTSHVSLANAEWGSEPQMATIGHLSASVGVWSLLFGPPVIDELRLQDVDILLETDDDGTGNWVMGQTTSAQPAAEGEAESGAFEMPVYIDFAEIDDVKLRYLPTLESGFSVGTLGITTNESGQHVLDGAGQWQEWPFSLAGIAADRKVELDATLGELALTSTLDYARDTVDVTALLSTLDKLGEILEVEGLPPAELSLTGTVGMEGDSIELSDVLAKVGSSRVALDGEVDTGGTSRLSIEAEGPSLSELKPELPAVPFTLSTDLVAEEQTITLDPLTLNVAESDLRGSAQFTGGDTPGIKLRTESSLIDLTPFEATEPADGEGAAKDAKSRYVFTKEPLPLDQLRNLQADVDVSVDTVKTSTFNILELETELTADDGKIDIENQFHGAAGGEYTNRIGIVVGEEIAELTLKSGGQGIKLGLMSGPDVPVEQIPPTNLDVDIKARGATARALASSTNGKVVMTQGAGRVANDVISTVSGDVLSQLFEALNPLAETEEFTNWECSVIKIEFTSGVGEMTAFLLQSQKLMVVAGGKVDLNTEKLDFEFNTKPREGVGLSADMFVTPFVKLTGTLANPGVGLNAKGALLSGGAAVMTGGMSFLYQGLVDRVMAQGDRCAKALRELGETTTTDPG